MVIADSDNVISISDSNTFYSIQDLNKHYFVSKDEWRNTYVINCFDFFILINTYTICICFGLLLSYPAGNKMIESILWLQFFWLKNQIWIWERHLRDKKLMNRMIELLRICLLSKFFWKFNWVRKRTPTFHFEFRMTLDKKFICYYIKTHSPICEYGDT